MLPNKPFFYYPISLTPIFERVRKLQKRGRNIRLVSPTLFDTPLNNVKTIVNAYDEQIIRIDGEIPVQLPVSNGERFLFISYEQSALTHGIHKYPAKFFPELPRWLIKRYSKPGDTILDPFCGSATTNIEALLAHRHSVGIDIEPFSRFIATVKTTPLSENELEISQEELFHKVVEYNPQAISPESIPEFPYRDHWFQPEILLELAYLKQIIHSLACSQGVKDYYLTCFSSIIRSVSNADDHCTRTVVRKKLNKCVQPSDALIKFVETVLVNTPRITAFSNKFPQHTSVHFPENMDARRINYPNDSFDLAVTSPPYVNAVDYPRTHQLEAYWLELASGSLTPQKKRHVGTESVCSQEYATFHNIGVSEADEAMRNIFQNDARRAYIAYKYLVDMLANLKEVYRVIKPGARYAIVVGNNQIRGVVFETWKYLMSLCSEVGFEVESYFGSEIIKHFIKVPRTERINTDWIIILRKPYVTS